MIYNHCTKETLMLALDNRRLHCMESCIGKSIKDLVGYGKQGIFIIFDDETFIVMKAKEDDNLILFTVDNSPIQYGLLSIDGAK